jgi:hypothetical protein
MVALVAMLLLAVLLLCAGCSAPAEAEEVGEPESSPRFIVERAENDKPEAYVVRIITDTETGTQYLFIKSGYGGGLTVLQPAPEEVTAS